MVNRRRFIAAAAVLPLSACKIKTINYFPTTPATVRYVNLMPAAGAFDIYNGGTAVWTNIPFEQSVPYEQFNTGQTTFGVNPAGNPNQLTSTSNALSGAQPYTLVTYGSFGNPSVLLLGDTALSIPTGVSQFRLFHGALGIAAFDVYVSAPDVDILTTDPQFFNLQYSTGTIFTQIVAGDYRLRLTVAATKIVIYDSGVISYPSTIATDQYFYSRGSALLANMYSMQVNGSQTVAIADSKQARLKVVNAAFQTGAINSLVDGTVDVSTIPVATGTLYRFPGAGSHAISFEASAVPGAPIAAVTTTLNGATDTTILVSGLAGSTVASVLNDNNLPPVSGNGRFRFVNASPDAPLVDVVVNQVVAATGVAYTKASAYYEIAANTCTVTFVDTASKTVLLTVPDIALQDGYILSVYLIGTTGARASLVTQDNVAEYLLTTN